jgi:ribonuclease R
VEQVQLNPQQAILQNLAIRTMAKAKYTIQAIGHFGLAFSHYTHFTSPIRRYPDMMVHYLLEQYLNKEKINTTPDEWEAQCKHSSDMEKRAADAERASIKYKQVEYMRYLTQQQIEEGQLKSYEGVITGLTEWGIYVEILETRCEGMIRMNDLYDDFYELEAENYRIIGKRTGRVISFGDKMYVKVKNTDLERRTMDLIPSDLQY